MGKGSNVSVYVTSLGKYNNSSVARVGPRLQKKKSDGKETKQLDWDSVVKILSFYAQYLRLNPMHSKKITNALYLFSN